MGEPASGLSFIVTKIPLQCKEVSKYHLRSPTLRAAARRARLTIVPLTHVKVQVSKTNYVIKSHESYMFFLECDLDNPSAVCEWGSYMDWNKYDPARRTDREFLEGCSHTGASGYSWCPLLVTASP